MKTRLGTSFITAIMAGFLLVSCVSSKKYKASQATVQQLRNDSTRLAQEVSNLNTNVQSIEQKNKTLQQSLDSSTANYATQQKSLEYYQTYFSKQQTSMTQLGEELKNALTQAGVSNDAIQQMPEGIYINLDESNAFKKNSATTTTTGKQALSGVTEVLKNHPDVNVTVTSGDDDAAGQTGMTNDKISTTTDATTMDKDAKETDVAVSSKDNTSDSKVSTSKSTTVKTKSNVVRKSYAASKSQTTAAKKKRTYKSEGYSRGYATTGTKRKSSALKTGRVNTVANSLLDNGLPKVNLLIKQPPATTTGEEKTNVKIIVSPTMTDFKPAQGASASKQP